MIGYIARYRHIHSWVHKRNSPCMRTYNGQSDGRNNDMAGTVKINKDLSEEQIINKGIDKPSRPVNAHLIRL